jgi:hypothetical protein
MSNWAEMVTVLDSSLGQSTDCTDRGFSGTFLMSYMQKLGFYVNSVTTASFRLFPIHHSFIFAAI